MNKMLFLAFYPLRKQYHSPDQSPWSRPTTRESSLKVEASVC